MTFDGIHNSYENCNSSSSKQNEFKMDMPVYLGYVVLDLSNLLMYET